MLAARCFSWCPTALFPSTSSLLESQGWGPTGRRRQCHPVGQTQKQDPSPMPWAPQFIWMMMAMEVCIMQVRRMQVGDADACLGNAGRDVGKQVISRWLPWLGDGLLLPEKALKAATPHTQSAAFHTTSVSTSGKEVGREGSLLGILWLGADVATSLPMAGFFSLCEKGLKGEEKVWAPTRCAGDGSELHSASCPVTPLGLPSSESSEGYLNPRGGFFSAGQNKGKQIQLLCICKPSLCPIWSLLPPTTRPSAVLLRWATEGPMCSTALWWNQTDSLEKCRAGQEFSTEKSCCQPEGSALLLFLRWLVALGQFANTTFAIRR